MFNVQEKEKVNPAFYSLHFSFSVFWGLIPLVTFFFLCHIGSGNSLARLLKCARVPWWIAPVGLSSSVCALLSDNNPNHFSPMLSPPARSGRYTPSAVLHLIGFLFVFLYPLILTVVAVWQHLRVCPLSTSLYGTSVNASLN